MHSGKKIIRSEGYGKEDSMNIGSAMPRTMSGTWTTLSEIQNGGEFETTSLCSSAACK